MFPLIFGSTEKKQNVKKFWLTKIVASGNHGGILLLGQIMKENIGTLELIGIYATNE